MMIHGMNYCTVLSHYLVGFIELEKITSPMWLCLQSTTEMSQNDFNVHSTHYVKYHIAGFYARILILQIT